MYICIYTYVYKKIFYLKTRWQQSLKNLHAGPGLQELKR